MKGALSIGAMIVALYGRTLGYGLAWDDYAALRPRTAAALLGTWTGPWDPGGIWPDFYRPLSIAVYQTMFALFGHNAVALHAVNLVELGVAAWMLMAFVRRETASAALGLVAAVLLIAHPETPSSLAAWVSQQFHLVALIAVLGAMLVWQHVRDRRAAAWGWVLVPITCGVLMKEDTIMLVPTLLTWQWIRARVIGDVPAPSPTLVTTLALTMLGYGAWRTAALGVIGGYETPTVARVLLNAINGPAHTFGMLWTPSAHVVSLACGAGVVMLLATAWRHRHRARPAHTALALNGLALGAFANAPLLLISGHSRQHLMILASALTMTAALGVCADVVAAGGRAMSRVAMGAAVVWALAVATANWANTSSFAPCAPEAVRRDLDVLSWDLITNADRDDVTSRLSGCVAPNTPR